MLENRGERIGVYSALQIRTDTRATERYADSLAHNFDLPVDPGDWHVTLMDYEEALVKVRSPRDHHALDRTRDEVGQFLSESHVNDIVLFPDGRRRRLERFGGYLGVPLRVTPELMYLRSGVLRIARENLRDNTENNKWDPHISVVHWRTGRKGSQPSRQGPHAPRSIHIEGFLLGQGIVRSPQDYDKRQQGKQSFANRSLPPGSRH